MMIPEIGSEFWIVPVASVQNGIFPINTQWFVSGRSALRAIIAENNFKTVAMPDWCCDSMIVPFIDGGIAVSFYDALNPPDAFDTEAILVMDYFGYETDYSPKNYDGVVIRDMTHSLFSKKYDNADYCFGSLRKWAGFYTGGFAWGFKNNVKYDSEISEYVALREEAMAQKEAYISGKTESKDYLRIFSKAEEMLDDIRIAPASERDIEFARTLDVGFIKNKRRENAAMLLDAFADVAIFPEINADDCPLFVPIGVKNRDSLRRHLIDHAVYCPIHWPISDYHRLSDSAKRLYGEELSLVCDQRYGADDMQRIIDIIKTYEGR